MSKSKVALTQTLQFLSLFLTFILRLLYTVIVNLLTIILIFSVMTFGIVLLAAVVLLIYDFFFNKDAEENQASELISDISSNIINILGDLATFTGEFLKVISDNNFAQGLLFFTVLILFVNKLLTAGIKGFKLKSKSLYLDMVLRSRWAFEPIGWFQTAENSVNNNFNEVVSENDDINIASESE